MPAFKDSALSVSVSNFARPAIASGRIYIVEVLLNLLIRTLRLAAIALALLGVSAAHAQGLTKVRFSLDWRFEGQTSFLHMAKINGWFEQEGLDVQIDAGNGSAAAIQRIASGAYDIALGDITALIEFMGNNPGPSRMQMVYLLYDEAPIALYSLKKFGYKSVADAAAKPVTGHTFEIHRKLWPLIARAAKFDPEQVKWVTLDASLRANALIKGDAQFTGGFYNMPLEFYARGVKPEELQEFRIADLGIKVYGNGVIVSSKLIAESPKAVAAFVKVVNRAFRDGLSDPATSIRFLKQREPLVDEKTELQRFTMLFPAMLTDRSRSNGLGAVNKLILDTQVEDVATSFRLKTRPSSDLIFNSSFLPPKSDRIPLPGKLAAAK